MLKCGCIPNLKTGILALKAFFDKVRGIHEEKVSNTLHPFTVQLPVGTKFEMTDALVTQLETVVQQEVPESLSLRTSIGAGSGYMSASGPHAANLRIRLVDGHERERSTNEVVAHLRKVLSGIPDAQIWISSRGSLITRLLSRGGRQDRIEVEIRGHDLEGGQRIAERVKELVEGIEGTVNVRVSREEGKPELTVHVDRERAYMMALDLSTIADTLNTGLTGKIATRYREDGDEFDSACGCKKWTACRWTTSKRSLCGRGWIRRLR